MKVKPLFVFVIYRLPSEEKMKFEFEEKYEMRYSSQPLELGTIMIVTKAWEIKLYHRLLTDHLQGDYKT